MCNSFLFRQQITFHFAINSLQSVVFSSFHLPTRKKRIFFNSVPFGSRSHEQFFVFNVFRFACIPTFAVDVQFNLWLFIVLNFFFFVFSTSLFYTLIGGPFKLIRLNKDIYFKDRTMPRLHTCCICVRFTYMHACLHVHFGKIYFI